jgi:predicted adenylyl cyclase CyaB
MKEIDPEVSLLGKNKQLNHYFVDGDINKLYLLVEPLFEEETLEKLKLLIDTGKDFSVRTRLHDGKPLLVVKASIDDHTSANGISRIEFEAQVKDLTLDGLDQLLLEAGFDYQAKWSREREEYTCNGANICLDKNAGYGYVAEFEKVIEDEKDAQNTKKELITLMNDLGVEELPQDRLERMFAHYNENWPEYYGTDKIFTVE